MWLVWRPGSPDPSRHSPALHYDDPKKDRDTSRQLKVFQVKPEHLGMSLNELLTIETYNLPAEHHGATEGEAVKAIAGAR